jgi:aspartate/methionine/tyrosine aminotransferase
MFDLVLLDLAKSQPGLTLLLNTAVYDIAKEGNRLTAVKAFNWPWPDHVRIVTLPREDELEMAVNRFGRFLSGYHQ